MLAKLGYLRADISEADLSATGSSWFRSSMVLIQSQEVDILPTNGNLPPTA